MEKCVICAKEMPPFTYREPYEDGFICRKCTDGKDSGEKPKAPPPAGDASSAPKKESKKPQKESDGLSEAIDNLLKE